MDLWDKIKTTVGSKSKQDKIVELVKNKYAQRQTRKNRLEAQWQLNEQFYRGEQNIEIDRRDPTDWHIKEIDEHENSTGIVVNLTMRTLNDIVAMMLKNKPRVTAVPGTTDPQDIKKARYTEKLCDYIHQKFDMPLILHTTALSILKYGKAFNKVVWDKNKGRAEDVVTGVTMTTDEMGNEIANTKTERKPFGDVNIIAVSPFEILQSPHAKDLKTSRWFLHYYVKSVDEIKLQYPNKKEKIEPDAQIASLVSGNTYKARPEDYEGDIANEKFCVIKELYHRPCVDYPDGLYAKVVGDVLLETADLADEDWPWVEFDYFENTDQFWSEALQTHLNPINQQLNLHLDQMLCYVDSVVNAPTINPKNSGVRNDEITNSQSQIWNPVSKEVAPEKLMPPPIPESMFSMYEVIIRVWEEVSGISKPSKGQNVPGGRSGAIIQLLQEADQAHLIPFAIKFESSLLNLYRLCIKLVREHYDETRMIAVVGQNRAAWVQPFKKDLIIDDDLRIQMFSSLPQSKAAQQQFALNLVEFGLVNPQSERNEVFKMLDLGTFDKFFEDVTADEEEAERENDMLRNGQFPMVKFWQNHIKHYEIHKKFAVSGEFDFLKGQPVMIQTQQGNKQVTLEQALAQHMTDTGNIIQENMMKQQQLMGGGNGPQSSVGAGQRATGQAATE